MGPLEAKKGKEIKNKHKTKQKRNKEGLGPSEVALRATSPDPSTLPKKQKQNQQKKEQIKKQ